MIAKNLHLRRRKDGVEVITLESERPKDIPGRRHAQWNENLRAFVPVRYVASGRKGYLRGGVLESDFVVIGKADPNKRWERKQTVEGPVTAASMELMRERDIVDVRKRILRTESVMPHGYKKLEDLNPSPNAIVALDQAIHMILSGS